MEARRFGESAWLLVLGDESTRENALEAGSIASALEVAFPEAEVVCGGTSVLVRDTDSQDPAELLSVTTRQRRLDALPSTEHTIEVVYDGADLDRVAIASGLRSSEVIAAHADPTYRVEVVGFLPGFGYLAETDPRLRLPRLATPRKVVPKGSVGIAGRFTGIYPFASPGGWNLIGHAVNPSLFDASVDPPTRLRVGDTVHFSPIESPPATKNADADVEAFAAVEGAALEIVSCSFHASIQDLGRRLASRGIPSSGPLDEEAHRAANQAVGNSDTSATIELPLDSLEIRAVRRISLSVDGEPAHEMRPGDTFRVERGARAVRYVAIRGGIDVPIVLGSRANLLTASIGGLDGRRLRHGDRLRILDAPSDGPGLSESHELLLEDPQIVPIVRGPHLARFRAEAFEELCASEWLVSTSGDRMGVRLEGRPIVRHGADVGSPEPMIPGAIQIATDGTPIVLGPDSAVTGGYPVLAVLTSLGRSRLARVRPRGRIRFREVSGS